MAVIQNQRAYLLGGPYLQKGLRRKVGIQASQTVYPGSLLGSLASGNVAVNNALTSGIWGFSEQLASSLAAGSQINTTLALPHVVYEANATTTAVPITVVGATGQAAQNAGGAALGFGVNTGAGTTLFILGFGSVDEQFETSRFIGQTDANQTAGATNRPSVDKGVPGDDYPRIAFLFSRTGVIWGA